MFVGGIMRYCICLALLSGLLLLSGCSEKADVWTPRIGNFSYQDAENMYGPPTACQEMENGDRLCGWYSGGRAAWNDRAMLLFDSYGILKEVPVPGDLE